MPRATWDKPLEHPHGLNKHLLQILTILAAVLLPLLTKHKSLQKERPLQKKPHLRRATGPFLSLQTPRAPTGIPNLTSNTFRHALHILTFFRHGAIMVPWGARHRLARPVPGPLARAYLAFAWSSSAWTPC